MSAPKKKVSVSKKNVERSKSLKTLLALEEEKTRKIPLFLRIKAVPSCLTKTKYCDITGLEAMYTDPKTGLHFYSSEIYKIIRKLSPSDVQVYLSFRNAAIVLK